MNQYADRINELLSKHSTGNNDANNGIYSYWWDDEIDEELVYYEDCVGTMERASEIAMLFLGEEQDFRRFIREEYIEKNRVFKGFNLLPWVDAILETMNLDDTETYIALADTALKSLKDEFDDMLSKGK